MTARRPLGSNQSGIGQFNERVVLHAIRLHGALPKAEIARVTQLTAQTVSLVVDRLDANGLVMKRAPVRGKVGQPSVPIALDPDGAYAVGVHIGRRRLDALLVDFDGAVRERVAIDYAFPDPERVFVEIGRVYAELRASLPPKRARRLQGIGVAAPLALGGWHELLGVPERDAAKWHGIDIGARVQAATGAPVWAVKDTAAACVAELVAGRGRSVGSFVYLFVDTFIGGGLVLDSQWHGGLHGNAGAVGSLPVELRGNGHAPAQLLSVASLFDLEQRYARAGLAPGASTDERALAGRHAASARDWLSRAAPAIAYAVQSAICLLDLGDVIIDGACSRALLDALLAEADAALDTLDWQGVARPALHGGTIGSDARAIGGALLPLYALFTPDREVFVKRMANERAPSTRLTNRG